MTTHTFNLRAQTWKQRRKSLHLSDSDREAGLQVWYNLVGDGANRRFALRACSACATRRRSWRSSVASGASTVRDTVWQDSFVTDRVRWEGNWKYDRTWQTRAHAYIRVNALHTTFRYLAYIQVRQHLSKAMPWPTAPSQVVSAPNVPSRHDPSFPGEHSVTLNIPEASLICEGQQ